MGDGIHLFMWPWQRSYRAGLKYYAESVLKEIGLAIEVDVVLVGIRRPDHTNRNAVCIEPEFKDWPLSMFDGIVERIEEDYKKHPLHQMFYSNDQRATDAKPENARRDTVRSAVKADFAKLDDAKGVASFVGYPRPVGDFHVVPVIQVPKDAVVAAPALERRKYLGRYELGGSFLDACMREVLDEATAELEASEPGVEHFRDRRSTNEILERAATAFLRIIAYATARETELGDAIGIELFSALNDVSALKYERAEGAGNIVLVDPNKAHVPYAVKLEESVPFRNVRFARKLLEMSSAEMPLVANGGGIQGLLQLDKGARPDPESFTVSVLGYQSWQVRHGERPLLRVVSGKPVLPFEEISRERFLENFLRVVGGASQADAENAAELMQAISRLDNGCMVVFAPDANLEIERLSGQGMRVKPAPLNEGLLESISKIDGSILVDRSGNCYGVGVILDGMANDKCDPARGSRFNSAVRYVEGLRPTRLAIVKSDDGSLDVIPLLRPRIEHRLIDEALASLEVATVDNFHMPRLFLDRHRFYLSPEECVRANLALDRLEKLPPKENSIMIITQRFRPNPDMNQSYFL